jgi:hypothetical protein
MTASGWPTARSLRQGHHFGVLATERPDLRTPVF